MVTRRSCRYRACHRRQFLGAAAATLTAVNGVAALHRTEASTCTFSFGTYGMKSLTTQQAIEAVAAAGYDGIEIAARPDWDSAPERMSTERRRHLRDLLRDSQLRLTALMEHLVPSADDAQHARDLDRLKRVAQLGHELSPSAPPLIQTVLGGGRWEDQRDFFRARLADWAHLARRAETVIAIKPHRGGAMSRPSEAVWLIQQLGDTPWIRMVYDYSHYAFRDMPLAQTVATALPYTAHIAVKDAVRQGDRVAFQLPGASGEFDYANLLRLFYEGGYRGDVCCEVSGMVWGQPGYDPLAAARTCYRNLAPAFVSAGIPR